MKIAESEKNLLQSLLLIAALVVIIAGMHAAEPILVPLLMAVFISILLAPLMFWLQRKGLPKLVALVVVLMVLIAIIFTVMVLAGSSLDQFLRNMPSYQLRLQEQLVLLISWLNGFGFNLSQEEIFRYFDPGVIFGLLGNLLGGLGSVMTNGFLILLTVIFMLAEAFSFPAKLRLAFGDNYSSTFFDSFTDNIQRYMGLKTIISIITGITIAIWTAIIGIDYPVLWGLIALMFNFVPNIGSIMASVPAILLALVQLGFAPAIYTWLGYLLINITIGDLIEPRVLGKGLGLSTLVVFLSLVIWAWVLGPIGMFLSVPLTMTIKIALDSNVKTRWLAILLSSEESR
ncbi:MAG: AI-2 transport protein TqsA [Planctomycetota bacterium]|jgi:AI-2 transport protein TqsA